MVSERWGGGKGGASLSPQKEMGTVKGPLDSLREEGFGRQWHPNPGW